MFQIKSIYASYHDTSSSAVYPWKVIVEIKIPVSEWTAYRKNGQLGQLYGCEVSNAVYHVNNAIPAHCPHVDDTSRAKQGVKSIWLTYYGQSMDQAAKLGLKVEQHGTERYLGFATSNKIL
jgi:hypothetical protein